MRFENIAGILDVLPAGVWVARVPDGGLVYANAAFEEILGMRAQPESRVGAYSSAYGIYDQSGNVYPEARLPFSRAVAERATVVVDDIVIHRSDGRRVNIRAMGKPVFGDAGQVLEVVIAFFDITSEVSAQRAQREAELRLRAVVNNAPVALWAFDENGVCTLSEGRALAGLGLKPGQFVGRSVFDLYPNDLGTKSQRRVLSGETVSYTERVGGMYWDTRIEPVRAEDGKVVGGIGIATDVSEQRKLELQLVHADRMVSMGRLAASVAHEINNPLQYVLMSLHLASTIQGDESARLRCIADALEGTERVRRIAADLRTFARPNLEKHSPVELAPIIGSALRMSSVETIHRATIRDQLQPCPRVFANEARLGQVFLNLILNASQAIPEGAGLHEIVVSTSTDARGWAVAEVRDTGVGIPHEILGKIFDPFFSTKPIGTGSGLGLSVTKHIVEALGGEMTVTSTLGQGSTFRVCLPPASEGTPERVEPVDRAVSPASRARILIIDDDVNLGRVMATALHGHEATVVTSGAAGLTALLEQSPYDLVLCDLMMREVSGVDLYEALKVRRPGLEKTLVFMTGGAFTPRARAFLESVENQRVEKPFEVRSFVDGHLSQR